jgi:hypothetical protein
MLQGRKASLQRVCKGYISSYEANGALIGKGLSVGLSELWFITLGFEGPGNYLIRFSKSNPGAFAVTFVDSKGRVKHCLL